MGELEPSLEHLKHMIAFYDPEQHASLAFTLAQDPGVSALAWASLALWLLGYPDQALQRGRESLALAHELDHPFTLSFALSTAGVILHQLRREEQAAQECNEAMLQLSMEGGFPFFVVGGTILQGWTVALAGQAEVGIAGMRKGLDSLQAMGTRMQRSHWLALLAEALASAGQVEEALDMLARALAHVEETGERYYEAEIYRLQGALLVVQDNRADAEARIHLAERSFQRAIQVARRQKARSWELRAVMSLARLWRQQGRVKDAQEILAEIYGWFTEGFDTADLREAEALLKSLEQAQENNH
jgi:adenylate cyclase